MILQKLEMNNFRQYIGEQTVEFSTDPEKNVTVLIGVNTSGKTGVSYNKEKNMWTAYITVNYKTKYLGDYTDFNDAVNVRKEAEKKYDFTCDDIVANYDKEVI